jgi:hypothetical protein
MPLTEIGITRRIFSMFSAREKDVTNRPLDIDEIRLVSDLRIMHSKVDEIYQVVKTRRERHDEASIVNYADAPVLANDITKVDEIYMWFVTIKEEVDRRIRKRV